MEPTGSHRRTVCLMLACVTAVFLFLSSCGAQVVIPSRPDGFLYGGALPKSDSIVIDAFFDPVCPDSRDSWPALKLAVELYAPRVCLAVHTFPLPYHDNSFIACRSLHIVDGLNSSATYPLLEAFFKYQGKFYNQATSGLSKEQILAVIAKFTADVVGPSWETLIENGFLDDKTDMATRTAFKYAASRGVTGTPFFFVNGFALPGSGSPVDFNKWKEILDSLVSQATAVSYHRKRIHHSEE